MCVCVTKRERERERERISVKRVPLLCVSIQIQIGADFLAALIITRIRSDGTVWVSAESSFFSLLMDSSFSVSSCSLNCRRGIRSNTI